MKATLDERGRGCARGRKPTRLVAVRCALVGIEASEFRYFSELDTDVLTVPGLVLARELWTQLGRPVAFERFTDGDLWLPYRRHEQDL